MKKIQILSLLVIAVLFLSACKKEKPVEPTPTGPSTTVITHISGMVIDPYGYPISGVTVTCGTRTATTDFNGTYSFLSFVAPKERFVVKFAKANYYSVSRAERPLAGAYTPTEVTMIPYSWTNSASATFDASSTYTMYVGSTGCEIDFPANAWINDETEAVYTGSVTVYAAYMNPADLNFSKYVPGGLMIGKTIAAEEVMVQPYTGLMVEVFGASGEKLNLNPLAKANATVRFQIPSELLANSPDNIDLWDFDMDAGVAGAGGSAAKTGDKYVGEVIHFSSWSCEQTCAGGSATIKGNVTDGVNPVRNVPVSVGSSIVYTDASGNFSQQVPAGVYVNVGIKQGYLGNTQIPLSVGPLTNAEVYTIPSSFVLSSVSYLTGQLVNCTGSPVQGHVIFNAYSQLISASTDATGHFSIPINTSIMYGYLVAHGNGVSEEQYISISGYPFDCGQITLCPPVVTGPNEITFNGTLYNSFDSKSGSYLVMANMTSIFLENMSTYDHVSIQFAGNSTGTFAIDTTYYVNGQVGGMTSGTHYESLSGTLNVTRYGPVGGLIEGTFSATCRLTGYSYTGKFSVVRGQDMN